MISEKYLKKKVLRILVCVGLPLYLAAMAAVFYFAKMTPPCIFYQTTHLHCPGCGTGRAMLALLSGDILKAIDHNPLAIATLPIAAYFFAKFYLAFLLGRDILPVPTIKNNYVGISVLVIILLYFVLRNIPVVGFTILAP